MAESKDTYQPDEEVKGSPSMDTVPAYLSDNIPPGKENHEKGVPEVKGESSSPSNISETSPIVMQGGRKRKTMRKKRSVSRKKKASRRRKGSQRNTRRKHQ